MDPIRSFYDALADYYHFLFDDWDRAIDRQGKILKVLLESRTPGGPLKILDCACGVGTQSIALAKLGHRVTGSDLSSAEIGRARREARTRSLAIDFHVSDMSSLSEIPGKDFDVVIAFDNAIPHLRSNEIALAMAAVGSVLKPGGLFLASIRDYDRILLERPTVQAPAFYSDRGRRRIVHQVWDWVDDITYNVHLFINVETGDGWDSHHFVSEYHCVLREQLSAILHQSGFTEIEWKMPAESGFYQPIVLAKSPE